MSTTTAMRINLIPESESGMTIFGHHLATDQARSASVAIFVALLAITPGWIVMTFVNAHTSNEIARITTQIDKEDDRRQQLLGLADELARFQLIDKAAGVLAMSGQLRALRLAQLGNVLPNRVWYDRIEQDQSGWHIVGRSLGIDDIARAITSIGSTTPGLPAGLENLKQADNALEFAAFIGSAKSDASAPRPRMQLLPAQPNGGFTPGRPYVMPLNRPSN
jgi:hypothetical protein